MNSRRKVAGVILITLCVRVMASSAQRSSDDIQRNVDYTALMDHGRAEYRGGHFVAAERFYLAALRALERTDAAQRAIALAELGDVYVNEDELSKAARAYEESVATFKRLADKNRTVLVLRNLGATYSLERRDDEALRALREALKTATTVPQVNPVLSAEVLNCLGIVYYRMGKNGKAERFLNQAIEMVSTLGIPFDSAELLNNLGAVYHAKHDFQRAENLLKHALRITEGQLGPVHPNLSFTLMALGALYTDSRRYADAEEQYQRALRILEADTMSFDTRIARILHALSSTYTKAGRKVEAEMMLAEAAIIARRNLSNHAGMAEIVDEYSTILKKQGKSKEAEELRVEAKRARVATGLVISAHNPF